MTKSKFKEAMQRGLGRCLIELRRGDNPEKYRYVILWGCLHNLSFDTQCEGTRARYIYELATAFEDEEYFVTPTIETFLKLKNTFGWDFAHFCDLLCCFAENNNLAARDALYKKYRDLYAKLLKKKSSKNGFDHVRDNFEYICCALTSLDGMDAFIKISADIGMLFEKNRKYDGSDFSWFYSNSEDKFTTKNIYKTLEKRKNSNLGIKSFINNKEFALQEFNRSGELNVLTADEIYKQCRTNGKVLPKDRVRFSRHAAHEEKTNLAKLILIEEDQNIKAELLTVFRSIGFPLDPTEIIRYATSENPDLSQIAYEVLGNSKSESVLDFGTALLKSKQHIDDAICMLITNYSLKIKTLLLSTLNNIEINYFDKNNWHGIVLHIIGAFGDRKVKGLPKELLLFVYERSLCSCCRESAVRYLAEHRWLTDQLINECVYDSYSDIRNYINRYHKKKVTNEVSL